MQQQRRDMVKWVVEQLGDNEFDNKVFTRALDEVYKTGFENSLKTE